MSFSLTKLSVAALAIGWLAVPSATSVAHEIPSKVTVLAFVKPDGHTLRLLVRAPLAAMRDIEFPQRGLGYLDIARATPLLHEAARTWIADVVELYEEDALLARPNVAALRISLPSDRSFAAYETALANVRSAPLSPDVDLPPQQALLDVLLEYRITSPESRFAIRPALSHLGLNTTTVLRFNAPNGTERAFQYTGDPGVVRLDPRWHQAALRFVQLGFAHILDGVDHLLFLLGLVIPFRRIRPLIAIVTSFTVAHSMTLIASALGLAPNALWFPPLIEVLIALSIVYMAFENIVGARFQRRWVIAFAFGLVHGFGFSFALRETMQFAGGHLITSLLAFNVGVELGQLLVVAIAVPLLSLLFRRVVAERMGTILLSALVAHTAWHWMTERWGVFREYTITWPAFDLALAATVLRVLMVLLLLSGALWFLSWLVRRLVRAGPAAASPGAPESLQSGT
ncbi:MAG TPA: HupE/UreJ family protein [Gemmatimonadaceae bacterium]|nr:HupE/UreJ family protein [Gemmatimonadaceae bacterium]